jgi:hypothetical protein
MAPTALDPRRRDALARTTEFVRAWEECRDSGQQPFQVASLHQQAEDLIDYLLRTFPGEPSQDMVKAVVGSRDNYLHADMLATLPDVMVPFAIVHAAIRNHRMMLNLGQVSNWSTLMKRYNFLAA